MANSSNRLWSENYKITSLLVNSQGRLGLYGLLNLLQETAWMHAETVGLGMKDMVKHGHYWVLTRQNLQMKKWPKFGDHLSIQTWLQKPEGGFISREFQIDSSNGENIGTCTTSWLALDRKTRQIIPASTLRPWEDICRDGSSGLKAEKLIWTEPGEVLAKFRVRNSDLDINNHVNNTKYAQWILDSIPHAHHQQYFLQGYSVNFLAETHIEDVVQVEREQKSSLDESQGASLFRGVRAADGKVLFTARLEWLNLDVRREPEL